MQTDHGADHSGSDSIIDEKSIQDKLLSILARLVLVGLIGLGYYWQTLPLPPVQVEEESQKK